MATAWEELVAIAAAESMLGFEEQHSIRLDCHIENRLAPDPSLFSKIAFAPSF